MNEKQIKRLAIMAALNIIGLVCWAVVTIHFGHWWIMLFAILHTVFLNEI